MSARPEPRRRGRPVVDDKRRRVLDAALQTFAERGFHGTTVPDVASAAKVATGTLYHYFENKQELVNELYRETKLRLRARLLDDLGEPDVDRDGDVQRWFLELWRRMAAFAADEADAFRFLEMQDHVAYLDAESRQVEMTTLVPMLHVARKVRDRSGGARTDVVIALIWGAFVGLVKASRLGYLKLDARSLEHAGQLTWRMFEPEARRAATTRTVRTRARASS